MDLRNLKRVNDLWSKIYPYLAIQVMEHYDRSHGEVLELGPFSGGISVELARLHPGLDITIAAQDPGVVNYLRKQIEGAGFNRKMEVDRAELDNLVFADRLFDLVIFRGAYFFLDEEGKILREIYRVLKEDGVAFIGGGYGRNTPQALIDEIADESRDLNDRLGRRRVTEGEVTTMVNKASLTTHTRIEKDGGLWLVIQKQTVGHKGSFQEPASVQ
jgi:ubiquinone/menaquinone biosynthesis C-methylase UbiE